MDIVEIDWVQYVTLLGELFVLLFFVLGIPYTLLRNFFCRAKKMTFSYLPLIFFAIASFVFLISVFNFSWILCLPGLLLGAVAGYFMESITVSAHGEKGSRYSARRGYFGFISRSSSSSSGSSSSSSGSSSSSSGSNFGGGGFSGGGGSSKW